MQSTALPLHGVGWNNKHGGRALVAYVDSIVLSGDPTDITGAGTTGGDDDKPEHLRR